jgi:hypothetical protein
MSREMYRGKRVVNFWLDQCGDQFYKVTSLEGWVGTHQFINHQKWIFASAELPALEAQQKIT